MAYNANNVDNVVGERNLLYKFFNYCFSHKSSVSFPYTF